MSTPSDPLVQALVEDELLLEEQERVALADIRRIEEELASPDLPEERMQELQQELDTISESFMRLAQMVAENGEDLEEELLDFPPAGDMP